MLRALHGGRTSFEFVRSHTGAPDCRSRGNEAADVHAGSNVESAVPLMTCEERFVFWRQRPPSPEHVSGNLRAVLRDICRQRDTQGGVVFLKILPFFSLPPPPRKFCLYGRVFSG